MVAYQARAAWYSHPQVTAKVDVGYSNTDPHYMNLSEDGKYLLVTLASSNDSLPVQVYKTSDLDAAEGSVSGLAMATALPGEFSWGSGGNGWKGGAISSTLGLAIPGSGLESGAVLTGLEIPATAWTENSNAFRLSGFGDSGLDGMDFNDDGTRLYANQYKNGERNKILVFDTGSLKTDHTVTLLKTVETPASRIRNLSCYTLVNGKEWVFFGEGDVGNGGGKIYCYDPSVDLKDGVNPWVVLESSLITTNVANVKVTGCTTTLPRLHIALDDGRIYIFSFLSGDNYRTTSLVPDVSIAAATTAKLCGLSSVPSLPKFRSFEVSDDGETAYFIYASNNDSSAPGLCVVKSGAVNAAVDIASGEQFVSDGSPAYAYYRFCVRKTVNNNSDSAQKNKFQISEFALYDAYGTRLNLALTDAGANKDASALKEGEFTASYGGGTVADATVGLFDGNTSTKCCLKNFNPSPDNESTWLKVTMRLKYGAYATSYNMASANDTSGYPDRNPSAWSVYGSEDGENWKEIVAVDDGGAYAATANTTWFNGGTALSLHDATCFRVQDGGTLSLVGNQHADAILTYGGKVSAANGSSVVWDVPENDVKRLPGGGYTGSGSFVKTGAGTLELGGINDLSGVTEVKAGTLRYVPMRTTDKRTLYAFQVMKTLNNNSNPDQKNKFQISELALYDKDGNRIDMSGMTAAADNEYVNCIGVGQYSIRIGNGVKTSDGPENLFDGNLSTKWCLKNVNPDPDDESTWVRIFFALPSGSPAVASYNIASANDTASYNDRNPTVWKLTATDFEDGANANWTEIDYFDNYPTITKQNETWFNNGAAYPIAIKARQPFARATTDKYVRFTVKEKTSASDANKVLQLSEFALYDAQGNRVNTGLSNAGAGVAAASLAAGQMTWSYGKGAQHSKDAESAYYLFDGDLATKMCVKFCNFDPADSATWCVITMRLKDDAAPIAAYNIATANDTNTNQQRNPKRWAVETSPDGVNWTTVHEEDSSTYTDFITVQNQKWFNAAYPIGFVAGGDQGIVSEDSPIYVHGGATVDLSEATGNGVKTLRINVSESDDATVIGFRPSSGGCTIDVVGTTKKSFSDVTLPLVFTGTFSASEVEACRVSVNGELMGRSYKLTLDGTTGRPVLNGCQGLMIIFR